MKTSDDARLLPGWLALVACVIALALAAVGREAAAQPGAAAPPPPSAPIAPAVLSGLAPMPGDAEVPAAWMPPGATASLVPSTEIFPPQQITIRFNHKKHVKELGQSCKVCHAGAFSSDASEDRLLPKPTETCDNCHDVDHSGAAHPAPGGLSAAARPNAAGVKAGKDKNGQCTFCHLGERAGEGGRVAPTVVPKPNLRFTHKKHLARNIQCGQCHGHVEELELATRDQLPRMSGCFNCHNMSAASRGDAKGQCTNCHVTQPDGRLQLAFSTGELTPPRWLHNAGHTPDWIERHKGIAADDSAFCGNCHKPDYCTDCHDGRVRPRKVHPNDWISMHPQAARQDNPRCVSCHQEQTFCGDCHRRIGVARESPSGARDAGRRFHPPREVWSAPPRGPNHHAWEAIRNLNACVSCHTERDCATCHGTKGISGGQGVDPHPTNFIGACKTAMRRNPRPCLVCHQSTDADLAKCR